MYPFGDCSVERKYNSFLSEFVDRIDHFNLQQTLLYPTLRVLMFLEIACVLNFQNSKIFWPHRVELMPHELFHKTVERKGRSWV